MTRFATSAAATAVFFACLVPTSAFAAPDQPEIVGPGTYAYSTQQLPSIAALISTQGGGSDLDRHFCGGSVITPTFILTAAHCLVGESTSSFKVVVGREVLSSGAGVTLTPKRITINPAYNSTTLAYDVALVELSTATAQTPIPIVPPNTDSTGQNALVAGWGSLSDNGAAGQPSSDQLAGAVIPVLADAPCAAYGDYDPSVMLCAGGPQSDRPANSQNDTCYGDSGGPLYVDKPGGGLQLAGITSHGLTTYCGQSPDVFTWLASPAIQTFINGVTNPPAPALAAAQPTPVAPKVPSNAFTIGARTARRGKGVSITLNVPGPGKLSALQPAPAASSTAGAGRTKKAFFLKPAYATAAAAGAVKLHLKPTAAARTALKHKRSLHVVLKLTYQPNGGVLAAQSLRVRMR